VRTFVRGFGEVCLSLGVVVLLFIAYLVWGTAVQASRAQHQFAGELHNEWQRPASPAQPDLIHLTLGQPFAFLRIPRLGRSWRFAVVEGTGLPQLALGPGHVGGTQLPGRPGNFAIAAHRVTAGNPFYGLPGMRRGDLVFVDTKVNTYEYQVTGKKWVLPGDIAVLDPVPGHPRQPAAQRLITLITCDPAWTGTYRVIVTGMLVRATPRSA
jgi:sortase A